MTRTLDALDQIGCARVLALINQALSISGVAPLATTDDVRATRMDSLSDVDRSALSDLDAQFFDVVEECMEKCLAFAEANAVRLDWQRDGRLRLLGL